MSEARPWNLWLIAKGVGEGALLGAASCSSQQAQKSSSKEEPERESVRDIKRKREDERKE